MDSTIVIKVNYGKTLRRFNAHIDEAGKLELSLDGLREKVLSLFSLSPEVNLTLTYLDEDGDSVTLADDDDLSDVMMQSLNPLRITAEVNSEKGNSSAMSSGNSTPMRSPSKNYQPLPDLDKTISEIFKNVPEPMGEALSKLSVGLASKAAASSPQLPELVQNFSKMLQPFMVLVSDSQVGKEPEVLGGDSAKPKIVPVPISVNQPSEYEKKTDSVFSPPGTNTLVAPEPSPSAVKVIRLGKKLVKISGNRSKEVNQPSGYEKKVDPIFSIPVNDTFVAPEPSPLVAKPGLGDDKEQFKLSAKAILEQDALKAAPEDFKADPYPFKNANFGGSSSTGPFNQNVAGQCPFSVAALPNNLYAPPPMRRNSHGGMAGVVHIGVGCDGCGVLPITGPRFKSKVKEDYDLCSMCFSEMGSEAEYLRYDRPRHYPLHPLIGFPNSRVGPPPALPQTPLKNLLNPKLSKMDSRFIMDVNVIDGTLMSPSTPFIKVWRMRNNGNVVWPQGTQLVWIGGDRLNASISAELQIPVNGIAVGDELEVAVGFTAPEQSGRYISYWRLASPFGQKFGQRVWVLIQVDAFAKDSVKNSNWQGLNLNFPPRNEAENVVVNVEPMVVDGRRPIIEPSNTNVEYIDVDGRIPVPELSNSANDLVEPLVVPVPTKDLDIDFPINDTLLVRGKTVLYPTVDSSAVPPVLPDLALPKSTFDAEKWEEERGEEDDGVEQILLRELEEMGFKQVDLNKEILRMNEYNLEQSVDDLCGVSEWDPILDELKEMGFSDKEVNKKLLKKNNGSIKGVVMDLISGEQA